MVEVSEYLIAPLGWAKERAPGLPLLEFSYFSSKACAREGIPIVVLIQTSLQLISKIIGRKIDSKGLKILDQRERRASVGLSPSVSVSVLESGTNLKKEMAPALAITSTGTIPMLPSWLSFSDHGQDSVRPHPMDIVQADRFKVRKSLTEESNRLPRHVFIKLSNNTKRRKKDGKATL
ncbi:aspartate racemase [Striga asiatica]|uniref:Aspartate racemase n=1 Tax=Striga asiatica TaxID=4170 RepID=A0A5A7Q6E8_STRAF|nr:aspartate racemase [Striga asiatica]